MLVYQYRQIQLVGIYLQKRSETQLELVRCLETGNGLGFSRFSVWRVIYSGVESCVSFQGFGLSVQPGGNPQKSAETPYQSAETPKQKHPKQIPQAKTPTGVYRYSEAQHREPRRYYRFALGFTCFLVLRTFIE